jgi:O-antigen ligase
MESTQTYRLSTISFAFIVVISCSLAIIYITQKPIYPITFSAAIIFLFYYLKKIIENLENALPLIVCLLWLVLFEPAPCDIFAIIAILMFVVHIFTGRIDLGKLSFPDVSLLIFLAFSTTSILVAEDASETILNYFISLYLILFHFFLSRTVRSYEQIEKLIKFYAVPCLITALVMFCEWFKIGRSFFIQFHPSDYIRASAFFKDPNVAGPFSIPTVLFSLATIIYGGKKYLSLSLLILCLLGIFFSLSRAAIISLAFGVIFLSLLSLNAKNIVKITTLVAMLVLAVSIFYLSAPKQSSRLSDTHFGVEGRLLRFEKGLDIIIENPILGIGHKKTDIPHDTFLLKVTQAGVIGGMAFLSFYVYIIIKLVKLFLKCRQFKNDDKKIIVLVLLTILLSYIPLGIVISIAHWRHVWFFTGLSLAMIRIEEKEIGYNC